MGERWEPSCYADFDLCGGDAEVYMLLSFMAMRTRSRPHAAGPLAPLREEFLERTGWSLSRYRRAMQKLEELRPHVRVLRGPRGHLDGVRTAALDRWDEDRRARGPGSDPLHNAKHQRGVHPRTREGSVSEPLDLFSGSDSALTEEEKESGSAVVPRGPQSDPSSLPRTHAEGMNAAGPVAGQDTAAGPREAEGFDGGVDPGPETDPSDPHARAAWLRGKAADERARGRDDWARVLEDRAARLERLPA